MKNIEFKEFISRQLTKNNLNVKDRETMEALELYLGSPTFEEVITEWGRLRKSMGCYGLSENYCDAGLGCPLARIGCIAELRDDPINGFQSLVKRWSDMNPITTFKDDLFTKFPTMSRTVVDNLCPDSFGYVECTACTTDEDQKSDLRKKCWNAALDDYDSFELGVGK